MLATFRVPQMSLGGRTQSSFSNMSLMRGIYPDRKSAFFVHFLLPASDPDKATSSNQAYRYHNDVHQRRHCTRRPHCQRAVTSRQQRVVAGRGGKQGAAAAGRRCSGARPQRGAAAAGRGCSWAEMQLGTAPAGRSGAQRQRGAAAAGCGRSGAEMQLARPQRGAAAAG